MELQCLRPQNNFVKNSNTKNTIFVAVENTTTYSKTKFGETLWLNGVKKNTQDSTYSSTVSSVRNFLYTNTVFKCLLRTAY